jgi:hypothetical protein
MIPRANHLPRQWALLKEKRLSPRRTREIHTIVEENLIPMLALRRTLILNQTGSKTIRNQIRSKTKGLIREYHPAN